MPHSFVVAEAPKLHKIVQELENAALKDKNLDEALPSLADYWLGQPLDKDAVALASQFIGTVELHLDATNLKAGL